jgi:hypothetical protein
MGSLGGAAPGVAHPSGRHHVARVAAGQPGCYLDGADRSLSGKLPDQVGDPPAGVSAVIVDPRPELWSGGRPSTFGSDGAAWTGCRSWTWSSGRGPVRLPGPPGGRSGNQGGGQRARRALRAACRRGRRTGSGRDYPTGGVRRRTPRSSSRRNQPDRLGAPGAVGVTGRPRAASVCGGTAAGAPGAGASGWAEVRHRHGGRIRTGDRYRVPRR